MDKKWTDYKGHVKLVNPANKRKLEVIVVGTGLAGASAAASLGELGYKVKAFCFQDSPRRAHSIAAQGGINAAKNYQNDGDSVFRLFYDTVKGGDYRAREGNVHRLAEVSAAIIDQCVAQGVPFAREYGGLLSNRSFGGTQVQRTFYAAGQTGHGRTAWQHARPLSSWQSRVCLRYGPAVCEARCCCAGRRQRTPCATIHRPGCRPPARQWRTHRPSSRPQHGCRSRACRTQRQRFARRACRC